MIHFTYDEISALVLFLKRLTTQDITAKAENAQQDYAMCHAISKLRKAINDANNQNQDIDLGAERGNMNKKASNPPPPGKVKPAPPPAPPQKNSFTKKIPPWLDMQLIETRCSIDKGFCEAIFQIDWDICIAWVALKKTAGNYEKRIDTDDFKLRWFIPVHWSNERFNAMDHDRAIELFCTALVKQGIRIV